MNYADIEKGINALGEKAKHNQVRFYVSSDKKFKEMKQQSQLFSFFIATLLHPICSIYTVQKLLFRPRVTAENYSLPTNVIAYI